MTIYFAALHPGEQWRFVKNHESLENATKGPLGAEDLLLNRGRQKAKNVKYGHAISVLVWEGVPEGVLLMRRGSGTNQIERVTVPYSEVREKFEFQNKNSPSGDIINGPPPAQISAWFREYKSIESSRLTASDASSFLMSSSSLAGRGSRKYLYGDRPTWELVLEAVGKFDGPVSCLEVEENIIQVHPQFKRNNVEPDLSLLSVNSYSRGNFAGNKKPRLTNEGSHYDRLFRIGAGRETRFTLYDPSVHGVWELADVGGKILRPRCVASADEVELEQIRLDLEEGTNCSSGVDARKRVLSSIVQREGQSAFRRALIAAYGGTCAVTGCAVKELLEAAHIVPYAGPHTNEISNGLPLRADIHKLFDLHLICIDPVTRIIHLSPNLLTSEYAKLEGRVLRAPLATEAVARSEWLSHHQERCSWIHT